MDYRDERGRMMEITWCVVFALYFLFLVVIFIEGMHAR